MIGEILPSDALQLHDSSMPAAPRMTTAMVSQCCSGRWAVWCTGSTPQRCQRCGTAHNTRSEATKNNDKLTTSISITPYQKCAWAPWVRCNWWAPVSGLSGETLNTTIALRIPLGLWAEGAVLLSSAIVVAAICQLGALVALCKDAECIGLQRTNPTRHSLLRTVQSNFSQHRAY